VARALKRTLRRWLYIGHRWVGIVTCLFFAMWFISGVVMMYVAFPGLSDKERLAALPDIQWEKVALSPDDAMRAAGAARYPRDLRLSMLADEPAYRITAWDGKRQAISAVNGRVITGVSEQQALAVAQHHPASRSPQFEEIIDRDQWSVTTRYDPLRPLYLIALGDNADTKLYISARSGEIALDTNRTERVWNWLGSIPHWIYPTVLRKDGQLWRLVVPWISGICLIVGVQAIDGLGQELWAQLAIVAATICYAGAAIFGRNFKELNPIMPAAGSMICGAIVLVPASLITEKPWTLTPSPESILALLALSVFSTALAFAIYFRLVQTLGSVGTTAQAYLRVPIGVAIGVMFLREHLTSTALIGLVCVIAGVAGMTVPVRKSAIAS